MRVNYLVYILISFLTFVSCKGRIKEEKDDKIITIKGSDTVLPLAQMEAENLMKKNKEISISVIGGGSGVGITALLEGTTEIAMASRDLKKKEKLKFREANMDVEETLIAFDAVTIIVNPANKVSNLTEKQIEQIYTGEIKNWKDLGGEDLVIVPYSRESSSGTYDYFKEKMMDDKNYTSDVLSMSATGAIVQSVSQTKGAIGYIGLAYITPSVKKIAVSFDEGKTFVLPTVKTAKDNTYSKSRPLYLMYEKGNSKKVNKVIEYFLSVEGQKIVANIGYVPLK